MQRNYLTPLIGIPFNMLPSLIGARTSEELRISGSMRGFTENVLVSNLENLKNKLISFG